MDHLLHSIISEGVKLPEDEALHPSERRAVTLTAATVRVRLWHLKQVLAASVRVAARQILRVVGALGPGVGREVAVQLDIALGQTAVKLLDYFASVGSVQVSARVIDHKIILFFDSLEVLTYLVALRVLETIPLLREAGAKMGRLPLLGARVLIILMFVLQIRLG